MISSLRGTVLTRGSGHLVVEVGGVGFTVLTTPRLVATASIGEPIVLTTALIVREDDLTLFGFATPEELEMFDLLRGVSGVGPRSALSVLSELAPEQIAQAVADEDHKSFQRAQGIGVKTAKLIVVSLTGKVHRLAAAVPAAAAAGPGTDSQRLARVTAALVSLGWREREAEAAAESAAELAGEGADDQRLLRTALAALGGGRGGAS